MLAAFHATVRKLLRSSPGLARGRWDPLLPVPRRLFAPTIPALSFVVDGLAPNAPRSVLSLPSPCESGPRWQGRCRARSGTRCAWGAALASRCISRTCLSIRLADVGCGQNAPACFLRAAHRFMSWTARAPSRSSRFSPPLGGLEVLVNFGQWPHHERHVHCAESQGELALVEKPPPPSPRRHALRRALA